MATDPYNGDLDDERWLRLYNMTPQERWRESMKKFEEYVANGGSLDPEYDPQDPYNDYFYPNGPPADAKNQPHDNPSQGS